MAVTVTGSTAKLGGPVMPGNIRPIPANTRCSWVVTSIWWTQLISYPICPSSFKEAKCFYSTHLWRFNIVGGLRDQDVARSDSDRQGTNFESCFWKAVSSHSCHHPQDVLLAQFSPYVNKDRLRPQSFHFRLYVSMWRQNLHYTFGMVIVRPAFCPLICNQQRWEVFTSTTAERQSLGMSVLELHNQIITMDTAIYVQDWYCIRIGMSRNNRTNDMFLWWANDQHQSYIRH